MSAPARAPIACGALGSYDRRRVLRLAELLDGLPRAVHEDGDSMLMLDREPLAWRGERQRGIGWIEGELWRSARSTESWQAAAMRGACGLVIDGRRRFLHSSVNGLSPLYWIRDHGAVYFASRIDPLVRSAPAPLSIDWDAWASIIALRYPLGDRTPFAEVRRLGQFSKLSKRRGRARVESPTWPWAEIEPSNDLATAADGVVAGLNEMLDELPGGLICPLSGGRDSRMLFCALADTGRAALAVSTSDDEGETFEEDLAEAVAASFGVPQERLAGRPVGYPEDWEERARRVEYQFSDHAWLVPVARRLEGSATPVPDGFGIDVFVQSERHFNPPEALDYRDGSRASLALLDALRRYGLTHRSLTEPFHGPIESRVREQFMTATAPYEGHPSQNLLSTYATRSRRGVGCYPTGLLGTGGRILTPGASDPVVRAALSTPQQEKDDGRLYKAIYERLAPTAGRLPSTADTPRTGPHLPRRWRSAPALEFHRRLLADGPLAAHLSSPLREWLAAPDGVELPGDLRLGIEGIGLLHSWWHRYRDCLREVDGDDLRR